MKINPTYSSGDINFIHDEAQIFVESIININQMSAAAAGC
jgi:hypothetical protein